MPAGITHFLIEQGATYSQGLTWKINGIPVDVTGYTARLKARYADLSKKPVIISMSTASGQGIALGGSAGTITLSMSATDTANLAPGKYNYDLELVSGGGLVTRLLKGMLIIDAEKTY